MRAPQRKWSSSATHWRPRSIGLGAGSAESEEATVRAASKAVGERGAAFAPGRNGERGAAFAPGRN